MNYSVLPPEINSLRMFTGAGSGPMLEAAVAWDGLASELGSAADSFASVTSGLAGQAWQGPASAAMLAAAAPYAGWLSAAAARAAGASAQAKAVASAFEAARAAMIHPLAVAANRNAFVQLVLSNLFGQNAPAIAAAEALYEEMWAQDVAAMVGYHGGASAAAAALPSWQQALKSLPGQVAAAAASPIAAAAAG
ncbi:PPE family protein, partial [Mycobacterium lacus]